MEHEIRKMLQDAGCVLEGEFFFALKKRGLVSKKYINLDPVFTDPQKVQVLGGLLIKPFRYNSTCIVGPAVGGIPLVYAAAYSAMSEPSYRRLITTAFAEKDGDGFKFDRMGFERAVKGHMVVIVEDISSSGDTTGKVAKLVTEIGGTLVGASLIWNRGNVQAKTIGVPKLHSLVTESVETWHVDDNPPGWGELPLVKNIGHPDYFPDYPGGTIRLAW